MIVNKKYILLVTFLSDISIILKFLWISKWIYVKGIGILK